MLYTRAGDKGTTTTLRDKNKRTSKSSYLIEALGTVDELNSWLGLCRAHLVNKQEKTILEKAQQNLFIIQAEIAGANKKTESETVGEIETTINGIEQKIGPTSAFIIPGDTVLSAYLDTARTVSRRAERAVIRAVDKKELELSNETKSYLNRLSSLLYAMERLVNKQSKNQEKYPKY